MASDSRESPSPNLQGNTPPTRTTLQIRLLHLLKSRFPLNDLGALHGRLASAAIFAIVHPPMSVIPVFIMGVCAAVIYERTKVLAAPMTVHAVYNAAVLGFQWNVMQ